MNEKLFWGALYSGSKCAILFFLCYLIFLQSCALGEFGVKSDNIPVVHIFTFFHLFLCIDFVGIFIPCTE